MKIEDALNTVLSNNFSAFFYTPVSYSDSKSYLFTNPVDIVTVQAPAEPESSLIKIQQLMEKKLPGFGYISYETGYFFEDRLKKLYKGRETEKLLEFYFFEPENVQVLDSSSLDFVNAPDLIKKKNCRIKDFHLNTEKDIYLRNIQKIKNYIAAGDTYQVNYTVKAKFEIEGDIIELFLNSIFNQSAKYSALINTGDEYILSFSPELFFQVEEDNLLTMPMKGTSARGKNISADFVSIKNLEDSIKDQAENLMIVDLLRNDMGKISQFGKVSTNKLFIVEKYETLFQMVSVITSKLQERCDFKKIITNLFPGGSITGAPKIRTMEIIKELEAEPRGIYTGALGIFNYEKSVFNIAIRTIKIDKKSKSGEMGIGSGIVWDSVPEKEYEETLLKSRFLLSPERYFEIFETVLIENGCLFLWEYHLERLRQTANFFLFAFDEILLEKKLDIILKQIDMKKSYRLKIILNKWGAIKTELNEFQNITDNVNVIISDKRIDSKNKYIYFKTTNRELYDRELKYYTSKGYFDVIFLNEENEVCEGAFTNIFIRKKNTWFTPYLDSGLLPGVYRRFLLEQENYKEAVLYKDDLFSADEIMLVNSVRKEIRAQVVEECP